MAPSHSSAADPPASPHTRAIWQRYPALASPDFRTFLIGQFVSLIGTWMQSVVQPYLAYRITGNSLALGMVGFAQALPTLLLTLPGGVLVERMNKRRVVIAMQFVMMLQAFALAYLTLTNQVTIEQIIVLSLVLGAASALEITARQSMLLDLVRDKSELPNAIALQSSAFNVARVLGPSLSAPFLVLFQGTGEGWAFVANGVSYLFVIISLLRIGQRHKDEPATPKNRSRSALAEFKEGQRFVLSTPMIVVLTIAAVVPSLLVFPFSQQVPAFAATVLSEPGDSQQSIAAINAALATVQGVGALIAALLLATFSMFPRKGLLITIAQFAQAFALIALGLSVSLAPSLASVGVLGWSGVTMYATINTVIQIITPNEFRGRVISTYLWATQGVGPFGNLLVGAMAQGMGVDSAAVICGGLALLASVVMFIAQPRVRLARH